MARSEWKAKFTCAFAAYVSSSCRRHRSRTREGAVYLPSQKTAGLIAAVDIGRLMKNEFTARDTRRVRLQAVERPKEAHKISMKF